MSTATALQELYDDHGTLTPALVVEAAADPDHELHDKFVWDDSEAARRYRLTQASGLIRSVHVRVTKDEPSRVRVWVSEREMRVAPDGDDALSGVYRPIEEVVASDVLRAAWFRALAAEWQALRRKAGASKEFADMVLRDLGHFAA